MTRRQTKRHGRTESGTNDEIVKEQSLEDYLSGEISISLRSMSRAAVAEVSMECVNRLVVSMKLQNRTYLEIGMILSFIKKNRLWAYYASHIKNMRDFLKEIDIGIGVAEANNYIRIWNMFGKYLMDRGLIIPIRRLLAIKPFIKGEKDMEEWIEKAKSLPENALNDEIREARGEIPSDACPHDDKESWYRCQKCRAWFKN